MPRHSEESIVIKIAKGFVPETIMEKDRIRIFLSQYPFKLVNVFFSRRFATQFLKNVEGCYLGLPDRHISKSWTCERGYIPCRIDPFGAPYLQMVIDVCKTRIVFAGR